MQKARNLAEGWLQKAWCGGRRRSFSAVVCRSTLVRRVRAGKFHGVPNIGKGTVHVSTFTKLTASTHADILVVSLWGIAGTPAIVPIDGRSLRCECMSKDLTAEVIGEQSIARLAIKANKSLVSSQIATILDHETKVNRQTLLVARHHLHCGYGTCRHLADSGGKTNGAALKLRHRTACVSEEDEGAPGGNCRYLGSRSGKLSELEDHISSRCRRAASGLDGTCRHKRRPRNRDPRAVRCRRVKREKGRKKIRERW